MHGATYQVLRAYRRVPTSCTAHSWDAMDVVGDMHDDTGDAAVDAMVRSPLGDAKGRARVTCSPAYASGVADSA